MANDEITDLQALRAFWNVDEEEAIRRAAHLCREMIDHAGTGGEVVLRGPWHPSLLGFMKKRWIQRLRFTPGIDEYD